MYVLNLGVKGPFRLDPGVCYHGFQRFLALGELGPKSRAAGDWGEAEPRRETSGTEVGVCVMRP